VAFVVVVCGVDGERPSVQRDDPESDPECDRAPGSAGRRGLDADAEERSEERVRGDDRPLPRPEMEDIAEEVAGEDAVSDPPREVERPGPFLARGDGRDLVVHPLSLLRMRVRFSVVMRAPVRCSSMWRNASSIP